MGAMSTIPYGSPSGCLRYITPLNSLMECPGTHCGHAKDMLYLEGCLESKRGSLR
jgi:hypothetical protein